MFLLCLLGSPLSFADESEVIVVGHREPTETSAQPGTVSVVRVDARFSQAVDLATVVESTPGLSVERLGGLGDWSSIRVRGSTPRQVLFLLDGVPLNPDGVGAVDLSEWPVRLFERVEVHRGLLPLAFAASPIGGAVNLVIGDAPKRSVGVGVGQWGTSRWRALLSQRVGAAQVFTAVSAFQTQGNFVFYDDRATVYQAGDDRLIRRTNSDKKQVSALTRVRVGDLGLTSSTVVREMGVGGPMGYPTASVRYRMAQQLGSVDWAGPVRLVAWGLVRDESLNDPLAELAPIARHTRSRQTNVGLRASAFVSADPRLVLQGALQTVYQQRERRDRAESHRRLQQTLGVESVLRTADERLWLRTGLQGLFVQDESEPLMALNPRLSIGVEPHPSWRVKGGGGRGVRPPDFTELYGDQGVIVGDPGLRSERTWFSDLGLRFRERLGQGAHLQLDGVLFEQRTRDLISYVQNAQRIASPLNLGRTRVRGVEGAALLTEGPWMGSLSMSVMDARDTSDVSAYSGKRLPRVPRFQGNLRLAWTGEHLQTGLQTGLKTGAFADRTNWFAQAPRRQLSGYVRHVWDSGLSVELNGQNLMNRRAERVRANPLDRSSTERVLVPISDFFGFALPGRTLNVMMSWTAPKDGA